MDSRKIGEALDKLQPEPSLHMDEKEAIDRALAAVGATFEHLRPIGMPRIPERLLNPRSAEYFQETRAKRFGMSLADLAVSDKAGENAWKNAEPGMRDLKNVLTEKDGPYVLGEEASFADFAIGGFWTMVKLLDQDGDLYDRLMSFDGSFPEHASAVSKWFEKDD